MRSSNSDNSQFKTSLTLISALQRHEESAWDRFVRIYEPLILFWIRHRGRIAEVDAQNQILQEVWLKVLKGLHGYKRLPDKAFRGWLWSVTNTRIYDHYESHHNQSKGGDTAFANTYDLAAYEEGDDATETSELVKRIMDLLTEKQLFVLNEFTLRNLTHAEIAEKWNAAQEVQMTPGNSRQILRRAKDEVRALLDPTDPSLGC